MAAEYEVLLPVIKSAVFSANPATINEKIVITVTVIEESVILEPEIIYSGEIYSGEV